MKANVLKKLNENIPDFIKVLGKNVIRKKLINNKVFIKQYDELKRFEKLEYCEKKEIQFNRLKKTLCYAYENTIYYKTSFDNLEFNPYDMKDISEFKKIPIVTKKEILDRYDEFISNEKMDYYSSNTGGSTGKILKILLDKDSIYKEKAYIYYHWSKLGYDYKKSKLITFKLLNYKVKKYNPLYNEMILSSFSINNNKIDEYKKIIEKFKPDFIHGYQSAIYSFCKVLKANKIKLSVNIKGVFLISETMEEAKRIFIEEYFNCKSLAFYGHTERSVFAEEGIDRLYRFNESYGFTEIETDNESNRIICTGFLNKKMPIIRYATDDMAQIEKDGFQIYGHRQKEVLIGKHEEEMSFATLEFNDEIFARIRSYQYVQREKGKFTFNIIPEDSISDEDIKLIKKILDNTLGNAFDYTIEVVNEVTLSSRGKFSPIIQYLN